MRPTVPSRAPLLRVAVAVDAPNTPRLLLCQRHHLPKAGASATLDGEHREKNSRGKVNSESSLPPLPRLPTPPRRRAPSASPSTPAPATRLSNLPRPRRPPPTSRAPCPARVSRIHGLARRSLPWAPPPAAAAAATTTHRPHPHRRTATPRTRPRLLHRCTTTTTTSRRRLPRRCLSRRRPHPPRTTTTTRRPHTPTAVCGTPRPCRRRSCSLRPRCWGPRPSSWSTSRRGR
jgi:hypothetical protein